MQITGGPQSGKSTLLRTIIAGFALTHTPAEVQFYGLDFGGGGMSSIAGLPHVGGVAPASTRSGSAVRSPRCTASWRGARSTSAAPGSTPSPRSACWRARGDISATDQPWGDVFLVIDGWGNFRTDYEGLEDAVTDIAARGLGYGIHLIVTASRSMEVRASLMDQLLEAAGAAAQRPHGLRLDRKVAANVPAGVPGRGQTPEKLHFMAAVPRIDGINSDSDLSEATAAMNQEVTRHWTAPPAPAGRSGLGADALPLALEVVDRRVELLDLPLDRFELDGEVTLQLQEGGI
ncbi:type VII secretion protein EccC [Streptomyces badius]